jgi:hypothetical protein
MATDVATEIGRLTNLPLDELRAEWHQWHPDKCMPDRLSRDLLVRTIAWKLQEREFGKGPASLATRLDRLSKQLSGTGILDCEREAQVKNGTTLVREWQGQTYRVTALDDGFVWDEQRYVSLSEVARAITGVRWSGPRFFGLKQKHRSPAEQVDA